MIICFVLLVVVPKLSLIEKSCTHMLNIRQWSGKVFIRHTDNLRTVKTRSTHLHRPRDLITLKDNQSPSHPATANHIRIRRHTTLANQRQLRVPKMYILGGQGTTLTTQNIYPCVGKLLRSPISSAISGHMGFSPGNCSTLCRGSTWSSVGNTVMSTMSTSLSLM